MAVIAVAFAAGIVLADCVSLVGCALLVAAVMILGVLVLPGKHRGTAAIIALVLFSGCLRYACDRSIAPDDVSRYAPRATAVEGVVVSDSEGDADSNRLTLRARRVLTGSRWMPASGSIMVSLYRDGKSTMPRIAYGDRVRIVAHPYIPSEPTNPGQFSWKEYLARHGIYACASARRAEQVIVLRRSRGHSLIGVAYAAKHYLVSSICKIHPRREASVMCGVVLGTYSYLDDDTLQQFTRTGTMHVLAASGYNCFVLLLFATPVLRFLRVMPRHRGIITVFLVWGYVLAVGPMPSLVRAAVMSSLMLLAAPLRRVADYANLFYVAAMALLVMNPSNLFDIGFQLSFLAVASLIMIAPVIEAVLNRSNLNELRAKPVWGKRANRLRIGISYLQNKAVGIFASTLVGTTAVGLVTVPVIAYYFHYFSLTSLPANLAVAFLVPVVFFDSFLSLVTALIPHGAAFAGLIGTLSTRAMLGAISYFGSMTYSSVAVQSPGILGIVGYYIVLFAALRYVRCRLAER